MLQIISYQNRSYADVVYCLPELSTGLSSYDSVSSLGPTLGPYFLPGEMPSLSSL